MDQITFFLQEIKNSSIVSKEVIDLIERNIVAHSKRMQRKYPNYDLFITGTGQSYGLKIQERIIKSFTDLSENKVGSAFDAISRQSEKIEIKSIKAIKGKSSQYIGARILNLNEETKKVIGGSFQQVKPRDCDWYIFHILYGNAERIFIVPSKIFSLVPKKENQEHGRLLLSGQHRGHKTEGQANVGQILTRAKFFEPSKSYSSTTINSFSFEKLKKEVIRRLSRLGDGWYLPEN